MYLIEKQRISVSKRDMLANIKQFEGVLKEGEGQSLLKKMRREERERESRFTK